jgi:hypothetical protein
MENRTLERARKKAQKIMEDLDGEGMFTLAELKHLLESEIQNRLRASAPSAGETAVLQPRTDRVFARVEPRTRWGVTT